jgi:hypothetical protein
VCNTTEAQECLSGAAECELDCSLVANGANLGNTEVKTGVALILVGTVTITNLTIDGTGAVVLSNGATTTIANDLTCLNGAVFTASTLAFTLNVVGRFVVAPGHVISFNFLATLVGDVITLFTYGSSNLSDEELAAAINPSQTRAIAGRQVVCGTSGGVKSCRLVSSVATAGNGTIVYVVPDQETEAKRLGVGLGIGLGVPFLILLVVIAGLLFSRSRAPLPMTSQAVAAAAAPGTTSSFGSTYYDSYSDVEYGSGYSGYSGDSYGYSGTGSSYGTGSGYSGSYGGSYSGY